jgi:hypothetical protein
MDSSWTCSVRQVSGRFSVCTISYQTDHSTGPKQKSSYWRKDNANSEEEWKDGLWCEDRSERRQRSISERSFTDERTAMPLTFADERQYLRSVNGSFPDLRVERGILTCRSPALWLLLLIFLDVIGLHGISMRYLCARHYCDCRGLNVACGVEDVENVQLPTMRGPRTPESVSAPRGSGFVGFPFTVQYYSVFHSVQSDSHHEKISYVRNRWDCDMLDWSRLCCSTIDVDSDDLHRTGVAQIIHNH